MEMHQVRYFLAVARALNFTRAADECNVTQPSLTRAIQKLEDEFGGLLFRRERARTHLTDLGREMLPHLEQALDGGLDVIIIERPVDVPDRLDEVPLYELSYLVLLRADHPLAETDPLLLAHLHEQIFLERAHAGQARLRLACESAGIEPVFRHNVSDEAQLQRLVAAGLGAGLLPEGVELVSGLVGRTLGDGDLGAQVILATISGRRRSPAAEAFVRSVRARAWPAG
jgi:DNA-binding transcriptional LysR family regulator